MKYLFIVIGAALIIGFGIWKWMPTDSPPPSLPDTAVVTEQYINDKHRFSFRYPTGYSVTDFADPNDDNADIVLVQNGPLTSSTTMGFQIRVQSIDEDIPVLTIERIKKDLPSMVINDPQDVILGDGDRAGRGVAFLSDDPAFGGTSRDVWFVFNRTLYQIRTYASYDPLVQGVLGSWEFR